MNKLRNNKGMSIAEALVAVLILLLVSGGLASGVSLANHYYTKTLRTSEANELFSTLESLISNELRYTGYAKLNINDNSLVEFFSPTFPDEDVYPTFVIVDGNKELLDDDKYGYVAIGNTNEDVYRYILAKGSYPNQLGVKIKFITYNEDHGCFNVELDIGTETIGTLIDKTFSVRCLNWDGKNDD